MRSRISLVRASMLVHVTGVLAASALVSACAGTGAGATAAAPYDAGTGGANADDDAGEPDAAIDGARGDGGAGSIDESPCTGRVAQPADQTISVLSKGITRAANVHVPTGYDPTRRTPLVLNFHGYSSNASQEELLSQMTPKADKEGFIVVYPEGLNSSWNAGACCGQSMNANVDDVAFVRDLIDALSAQLCVDAKRVFATGMSNGGFLSHRLGCELSTRIAAIAPVAGVLAPATCKAERAVPVMHFHGTADTLVPYDGSPSMGFPSVPDTAAGWAARDACASKSVETFRKGDAHCETFPGCAGKAEVTLCTIDNGGHTWPGGTPVPSLGNTTTDLSATDAMWTFFRQHPLP